jgi:hypothetical protein
MLSTELAALFTRDLTRLLQELRAFPDTAAIWTTAPGVTNAAGTLALHLEGNLREYIGRQIGRLEYTRDRPVEFGLRNVPQTELIARIENILDAIPPIVASLSDELLDAPYPEPVSGTVRSTRQFLVHLCTHLNYHLGQIDYLRRITTGNGASRMRRARARSSALTTAEHRDGARHLTEANATTHTRAYGRPRDALCARSATRLIRNPSSRERPSHSFARCTRRQAPF